MKLNEVLIKQLAAGKIAVKNDGTLEQLIEVIKATFPNDSWVLDGKYNYYFRDKASQGWYCDNSTKLPAYSISDFYTENQPEFKRGEWVEVGQSGNDSIWFERIYITTIEGSSEPYICVTDASSKKFDLNEPFSTSSWARIRKPKQIEVTREEIAAWKGCKPEQIVIV